MTVWFFHTSISVFKGNEGRNYMTHCPEYLWTPSGRSQGLFTITLLVMFGRARGFVSLLCAYSTLTCKTNKALLQSVNSWRDFKHLDCDLLCGIQASDKQTSTCHALDLHWARIFPFRPMAYVCLLCLLERSYQVKLCAKITIMLVPLESISLGQKA